MPASHTLAAIGLGSNLGDRRGYIVAALDSIAHLPESRLLVASEIIETEPVGPVPQGPYLNAAATVLTTLPPRDLLNALLEIESARGRDRSREQRWGPRTLDLDLLLYGEHIIREPGLTVPHSRLHERRFVLVPLSQIAPDAAVPTLGRTVRELLVDLPVNPKAHPAVQPP